MFIIGKNWKQPIITSKYWVNKLCCIYTVEYYPAFKMIFKIKETCSQYIMWGREGNKGLSKAYVESYECYYLVFVIYMNSFCLLKYFYSPLLSQVYMCPCNKNTLNLIFKGGKWQTS